jgi:hypothetical protein
VTSGLSAPRVFEFRDDKITRENVWLDGAAGGGTAHRGAVSGH